MELNIFVPITKLDVARREVWGTIAEERVDKSNEILDYEKSKPHFQEWSKGFETATEGKSLGNVRAMHGRNAAGKVIAMEFDDVGKRVNVGTKIVDDQDWLKCQEGVYTGFSIGGSYVERAPDEVNKDAMRYVAKPAEVSLVDNPCMYGAQFTAVKVDGEVELRKFVGEAKAEPEKPAEEVTAEPAEKIAARSDAKPSEGTSKYGNVKFADEKNKKYPIDTPEHVKAAWNYINKPKNAGKYDPADAKTIKAHIVAAWKAKIDPEGPPSAKKSEDGTELVKADGMEIADARQALDVLQLIEGAADSLRSLIGLEESEEEDEAGQVESLVAAVDAIENASDDLRDFIAAEIQEDEDAAKAAPVEELAKASFKSFINKDNAQEAHDHSVGKGAKCKSEKVADAPVEKIEEPAVVVATDVLSKLDAITVELATLKSERETKAKEDEALRKRADDLEAEVKRQGERVIEPGRAVHKGGSPERRPEDGPDLTKMDPGKLGEIVNRVLGPEANVKLAAEMIKLGLTRKS
jgi:hypothetical protein